MLNILRLTKTTVSTSMLRGLENLDNLGEIESISMSSDVSESSDFFRVIQAVGSVYGFGLNREEGEFHNLPTFLKTIVRAHLRGYTQLTFSADEFLRSQRCRPRTHATWRGGSHRPLGPVLSKKFLDFCVHSFAASGRRDPF